MRSLARLFMDMTDPLSLVDLLSTLIGVVLFSVWVFARRRGEAGYGCLTPLLFLVMGLLIVFRWEVLFFLF